MPGECANLLQAWQEHLSKVAGKDNKKAGASDLNFLLDTCYADSKYSRWRIKGYAITLQQWVMVLSTSDIVLEPRCPVKCVRKSSWYIEFYPLNQFSNVMNKIDKVILIVAEYSICISCFLYSLIFILGYSVNEAVVIIVDCHI